MKSEHSLLTPRDEVFRKIGRNVVNFQRIEMLLKHFVTTGDISGTVDTLIQNFTKKKESIGKRSLGQLIEAFHSIICGEPPNCDELKPDEVGLALGVRIEMEAEAANALKERLKALVAERNQLIHHDLGEVNFESDEECRQLSEKLDEQNLRIHSKMDRLRSLLESASESQSDLVAFIQSGGFAEAMKSND